MESGNQADCSRGEYTGASTKASRTPSPPNDVGADQSAVGSRRAESPTAALQVPCTVCVRPVFPRDGYAARVLSPAVENLVTQLAKLPGIGRRTAQRLTFHLLSASTDEATELAQAINAVKSRVRFCRECGNLTEEQLCSICSDPRRDRSVICVVEQPVDVVSLERPRVPRPLPRTRGSAVAPRRRRAVRSSDRRPWKRASSGAA